MAQLLQGRKAARGWDEFGLKVLLTLLTQPRWITRTVESVAFVDRHTVGRRISRHFAVPPKSIRPEIGEAVLLPVFGVPKTQFISCNLKDDLGHAVSLPPLPERAHYSADALCVLAERIGGTIDETTRALISELAAAGPTASEAKLRDLKDGVLKKLFRDRHFNLLATYLAHNYLVYVEVPKPADGTPARHMLRFELDARISKQAGDELTRAHRPRRFGRPGVNWRRPRRGAFGWIWDHFVRLPARYLGLRAFPYTHIVPVDGAGSLHLDLVATDGVAFGERHLRFYSSLGAFLSVRHRGVSERRARFVVPRPLGRGSAAMTVNIRPAAGLLRDASPLLLLGFAGLLAAVSFNYTELWGPTAPVSLLLIVAGLVSVITARPGEHPYASSVLFFVRLLAVTPLPLSIIAAFLLLTEGSQSVFVGCAVAAAVFGAILVLGRIIDFFALRPRNNEWNDDQHTRVG